MENQEYTQGEQLELDFGQGMTPEDIANMSEEDFEKLTPEDVVKGSPEPSNEPDGANPYQEQGNEELHPDAQGNQPATLSDADFRQMITSPFRANNTEVQVERPEDVIKFMQMGMNYQKKLGAIRPHLGALKSLEQNGLLDKDKVNFMVDLMKGRPEAVAQFLKEHEIDTYSLPDVEETPYQPNDYVPSEQQLAFDEVVEELATDMNGRTVLEEVKTWDTKSVSELYQSPQLLQTMALHKQTGLYQDTMSILTREKALGNIPDNVSMLDAYDTVATGLLNRQGENYMPAPMPQYQQQQRVVGNNLHQQSQQPAQNYAKASAGIPNGNTTPVQPNFIDPMVIANMSDDELAQYGSFDELVHKVRFKR